MVKLAVSLDPETIYAQYSPGKWGIKQNPSIRFTDILVHREKKKTLTWCDHHLGAGPKIQHIPKACHSTVVDSTTKSLLQKSLFRDNVSQVPRWSYSFSDKRGFRLMYHENHGVPYSM